MAAGVLLWTEYTVSYLDEESAFGRFLVTAGRVLAGLITTLALVNLIKPVLFTVDAESVYRVFPIRYVILVGQILLLLLISAFALSSMMRESGGKGKAMKYRALGMFGLIMAVFLFIQLWFPYLPLYTIAYLLGICMLHTLVINDEKENYRRDVEEAAKIAELKDTIMSLLGSTRSAATSCACTWWCRRRAATGSSAPPPATRPSPRRRRAWTSTPPPVRRPRCTTTRTT